MSSQNIAIRLKKPHTHAGVKYEAGAEIVVPPMDAEWLITSTVGELANPEKEQDSKSTKDAKK